MSARNLTRRPLRAAMLAAALVMLLPVMSAQATPVISEVAPASVIIGKQVTVRGTLQTPAAEQQVQLEQRHGSAWQPVGRVATTDAAGAWSVRFKPRTGGMLRARLLSGDLSVSAETKLLMVPKVLSKRLTSRGTVYPFLGTKARWRIAPASYPNGRVFVRMSVDGRSVGRVRATIRNGVVAVKLPTNGVGRFRAQLELPARGDFATVRARSIQFTVRGQRVSSGSNAMWNQSLRAALKHRGFYVPGGRSFDSKMGDAVVAFHKAYDRPRTTGFEASDWKLLTRRAVKVQYNRRGLHIEVDKRRQILMQVKDGRPTMIIHVSTGRTGNTPAGRHSVLWKGNWVPSLYNSMLYKSMAIRGAYAIHGYPSVPTYPASAGCIRVPMWIAAKLYERSPVGTPVFVYERIGARSTAAGARPTGTHPLPELTGVDPAQWADEIAVAASERDRRRSPARA